MSDVRLVPMTAEQAKHLRIAGAVLKRGGGHQEFLDLADAYEQGITEEEAGSLKAKGLAADLAVDAAFADRIARAEELAASLADALEAITITEQGNASWKEVAVIQRNIALGALRKWETYLREVAA